MIECHNRSASQAAIAVLDRILTDDRFASKPDLAMLLGFMRGGMKHNGEVSDAAESG